MLGAFILGGIYLYKNRLILFFGVFSNGSSFTSISCTRE